MAERKPPPASPPAASGSRRGVGLFTGIFIGILIGIGMALAVAVWLNLHGSPFQERESPAELPPLKQPAEPRKAPDDAGAPADIAAPAPDAAGEAPPPDELPTNAGQLVPGRDSPVRESQAHKNPTLLRGGGADMPSQARINLPIGFYLQAGAFRSAAEAEDRKAQLALLGQTATVQRGDDPGGALHRIRVGPFSTQLELERTREFLKTNGIESIPVRPEATANH